MVEDEKHHEGIIGHVAQLTSSWLSNPNTRAEHHHATEFVEKMHDTLHGLHKRRQTAETPEAEAEPEHKPAVTARKSLASDDHIISMIDGKPYKLLKRHIGGHGLTPEQYRERYKLPRDYPMVARNYAAARGELAKKIGLGQKGRAARKPAEQPAAAEESVATARATRAKPSSRKSASEAKKAAQAHLGSE